MLCRVEESNTMSVTMLLRRSPELDVATLGGMNLVCSTALRQLKTPPSRALSPQHAMSNNTSPLHPEHLTQRAHPQGRNQVVPHTIRLRDLQSHGAHGDLGSEVEDERVAGKARSRPSAQRGGSAEPAMQQQHVSQHAQHSSVNAQHARSLHAQSSTCPRADKYMDPSAEGAAFDLNHCSQKLAEQLPAGIQQEMSHSSTSTESAAPGQGRPLTYSRASSVSPAGGLTMGGAFSIQGPALDTDDVGAAEAADAAAVSEAAQGCSTQPSALATQLSRRSSTVRFMLASADPSQNPNAASVTPIPHTTEDDAEHAGHGVQQSKETEGAELRGADGMWASDRHTLSLSTTSSLKGVLKKTTSRDSAVVSPCDISRALNSPGVSFAWGALEQDSGIADAVCAMQSSTLQKQGSESFPSWLTGG